LCREGGEKLRIDVKGSIVSDDVAWIYDWLGIPCCNPKKVNDAIAKSNGEKLDVYINSGGGSIFAGSEIYSALQAYPGQVEIHVTGIAASAASVIACAGKSDISPTAMVMVHNVSASAEGDYHDMDKSSEVLQKANETIAAAYVAKTGMSEKDALAMMDKETWLSAKDAVECGLIDKIAEPKNLQLVAAYNSPMLSQEAIEKIRNAVKRPFGNDTDIFMRQKAQAQLNLIKLGGLEK
jgi:ATP-dependent Clp endopeptidase proteolytic subunit ClpP